jgi:rfaE bifunctional protein kinase chain/domain
MTTRDILSSIRGLRACVIGDICLDRWCTYDPRLSEASRETGIDRVAVVKTEITAGGGGTVANNLAALGAARVAVLGAMGDDGFGYELRQALGRAGVESGLMVTGPLATFTYTKLLNSETGEEDLGRIDFVNPSTPPREVEAGILQRLRDAAAGFDVILVSDQSETAAEGVVTEGVRDALSMLNGPLVWVDSRMRIERFRNVIVKPNEREAREACERLGAAGPRALRDHVGHHLMMVTYGPQGVLVLDRDTETWVRTRPVEKPVDICGAGDSFSAGAALALAAGAAPAEAARFGNLVTSVTIMKKGTGTASPEELLRAEKELNA